MTPSSPITLPPQVDIDMKVGDFVQFKVTQAGAFCCLTSATNFTPSLPNGLLPVGTWPNPQQYPLGAEAKVSGDIAYSFSTSVLECSGHATGIVGKVIHVGSGLTEYQKNDPK